VIYYGFPAKKLTVVAVTGTDGKTTTVNLIFEILKAAGIKAGMVSTVGARIGEQRIEMGLHVTTPDEDVMQKLFAKMADAGCTHAVVEVTSHRLAQYKTEGYNVKIAVLTNISHEHLDYHGSMEEYVAVKARLFEKAEFGVLNKDDPSFGQFKSQTIVQYSKSKIKKVSPSLAGNYNKYNIGAAEAVAGILGIQEDRIKRIVREFAGVPGRREEVVMGQKFRCIVDFAHTPNGLKNLLVSLREESRPKNRIILIFGCTGERDKEKRPVMGEIADKFTDVVIVTTDDVRGESQDDIYEQITREMKGKPMREDDRDKAIETGVKMAKAGDIVVAAGMGHETTQLIGKTEVKRSDRAAFERAVAGRLLK